MEEGEEEGKGEGGEGRGKEGVEAEEMGRM